MAMIRRLLCALSFHRLSVTEDVPGIEVAVCKHCGLHCEIPTEARQVRFIEVRA